MTVRRDPKPPGAHCQTHLRQVRAGQVACARAAVPQGHATAVFSPRWAPTVRKGAPRRPRPAGSGLGLNRSSLGRRCGADRQHTRLPPRHTPPPAPVPRGGPAPRALPRVKTAHPRSHSCVRTHTYAPPHTTDQPPPRPRGPPRLRGGRWSASEPRPAPPRPTPPPALARPLPPPPPGRPLRCAPGSRDGARAGRVTSEAI